MITRLFFLLLLHFTPLTAEEITKVTSKKEEPLPLCKHVNPYENLEEWLSLKEYKCNHTTPAKENLSDEELSRWQWGTRSFAFDALASERIGPIRSLDTQAHPLCVSTTFAPSSLTVSIVIIHHNEALSVLLRMLNGIFALTPSSNLKQIVLYEDASEEEHQLTRYLTEAVRIKGWEGRVLIERSDERQGLIRAKVLASRLTSGDVIIFLDSHCEVTEGWLPPLLQPIDEDPKSVVVPIVDLINPSSFTYTKAMVAKSGFDWGLMFKWIYLSWEYFETDENNVKPFESPSMPGGLLAMRRDFFVDLGEYDMGMQIWGAENVELSLKTWMCGGRVLVAPCSRVGHVFRMRRPYKSNPGVDSNLFNSMRVAKAWLGDYQKNFLRARPSAARLDVGDVTYADEVKGRLKCRDMRWYIDNIYAELAPPDHEKAEDKEEEGKEGEEEERDEL